MEFSEWLSCKIKPDLNGVYQCRDLSKPEAPLTYSLYKKGWHVDCSTKEEAALSIEMRAHKKLNWLETEFQISGPGSSRIPIHPEIQWRGLANRPPGVTAEVSDKWDTANLKINLR